MSNVVAATGTGTAACNVTFSCTLSAGFWVTLSFAFYGLVLREMQRMVNSAAKANEGTKMRLRGLNFIHNYSGWAALSPEACGGRESCCRSKTLLHAAPGNPQMQEQNACAFAGPASSCCPVVGSRGAASMS